MSLIEQEILGCLIKDNTLINETIIKPDYFGIPVHRVIFRTMKELAAEGKAADHVTLLSEAYQDLQELGDINIISRLETIGKVENFDTYERQFVEGYKKSNAKTIVNEWLSGESETSVLIDRLQHNEETGVIDEVDKNDILTEMMDLPYLDDVPDTGITSGLTDLDNITGKFQKTNSYIVGARPSMGKTATMLKFLLSAAKTDVVPLVFSLEMSKKSLLERLVATEGNINAFISKRPSELSESKKKAWQAAVNALYKMEFEIYDKPMQTIPYIRSQIRKAKRKHEGKHVVVMIDYLTLIDSTENYQSDHQKFTHISAQLKAMAKEYDCPVITLAQLSRKIESRNDKRPLLSDLRESGSIEQDADCVMFLYRDDYYNPENEKNELEIIVAKHRDGPTGTAHVYYNKATGKMADLSDY